MAIEEVGETKSILSAEKKQEMKMAINEAYAAFLQQEQNTPPAEKLTLEADLERIWQFVRKDLLQKGYTLAAENELKTEFKEEIRQSWQDHVNLEMLYDK